MTGHENEAAAAITHNLADDELPEWADLPEQEEKRIDVIKVAYHVPITREATEDALLPPGFDNIFEYLAEQERQFRALPLEEQKRILAEREAERAAAKAARTCEHCGCDPDEHGGY